MPFSVKAYGVTSETSKVEPMEIKRRDLKPKDIEIDIAYCGVCHSDLHIAHGDLGKVNYPLVTGHEIIGKVAKVGNEVSRHKVGDLVGVGCLINSCGECRACKADQEQYCPKCVLTYNSVDPDFGGSTQGGYSQKIVATEHFVLSIPENLYKPAAAPLLCAGITTYSPLHKNKIGKGHKVAIVGLGGLGHMGVKFAHAMGAEVWVVTTSASKAKVAHELGAKGVVVSTDKDDMAKHAGTFDYVLNTVPVKHDLMSYFDLLRWEGVQTIVGVLETVDINCGRLIWGSQTLEGSLIGGIKETQEMLNFCAENNVFSEIEMADYSKVNEAWERVKKNDVKYRFVLDNSTL